MTPSFPSHVPVPVEKLSHWMFAVSHGIWAIEGRIEQGRKHGYSTNYDQQHLETMQDLHMFLKMSWDKWMDDMETEIRQSTVAAGQDNG